MRIFKKILEKFLLLNLTKKIFCKIFFKFLEI